jgi:hypothetical protein
MIHQPLGGASGKATDIKIHAEHILKIKAKINKILSLNTGKSINKICKDCECDKYMDANEALEYGIIDNIVLYQYGLYPCVIAGEILGINEAHVSNLYSSLPIYTKNDINCSGDDIINLLSIEPGIKVKKILNDIELNILNGDLNNNREELLDYIKKNWE